MTEPRSSGTPQLVAGRLQAWTRGPRHSIRTFVTLAAAALTTVAVIGAGLVSERNMREYLTREVQARLLIEARHLAAASTEPLLADFPELTLHPIVKRLHALQPEMTTIMVTDLAGTIQGDPDARRLGMKFSTPLALTPVATEVRLVAGESLVTDGRVLVARVPVAHRDGRTIGVAQVGLRRDYVERLIARARRQLGIVLALVLIACLVVASLLMSHLLRPIAALRAGIERIGRGDLDTPLKLKDRTELGQLAEAIDDMAAQLRSAQNEMVERERLAHEVDLAREIQTSLIPSRPLECERFVIEGSNRAAAEVGGDYYDYFTLPDGRVGLAIADVSGKGLAGCLVMSMLSALLRATRDQHESPASLLATLDRQLGTSLQPGVFVTMFYAILDPRTGALTYASAGHTPTLIYRRASGTLEWVRDKGIPLGILRDGTGARSLRDGTLQLEPGDTLVQFTDGINEATNGEGGLFGFRRVEETVLGAAPKGADCLIAALHHAVERWTGDRPAFDDETVLVLRPLEPTAPSREGSLQASGPLMLLDDARVRGAQLKLAATLEDMKRIPDWLKQVLPAACRDGSGFEILSAAVFEACANIAEHGYHLDGRKTFDLWWVPAAPGATDDPAGRFLIHDQGALFKAENVGTIDFNDPAVWRRGRGFGLHIMQQAMREIAYHPGTPEGNITAMTFENPEPEKEVRHA